MHEPIVSIDRITADACEAAERGWPVTDNPYPPGTDAHAYWLRVWGQWSMRLEGAAA